MALGVSPLSQFASLLDMTPRLPEEQQAAALAASSAGGAGPSSGGGMSPLWQLASLMERTPRLPDEEAEAKAKQPADPEELRDALLNGGLESPQPTDTPGQLRRDLSNALLQAGALASPHVGAMPDSSAMPPPPPMPFGGKGSANLQKQRKRKLEADLHLGGGSGVMVSVAPVEGEDGEERLMLRELLDDGGLGLAISGGAKAKRSKAKQKEKGKPVTCRCDRSGCLKRYCVCFAAGNPCVSGTCKCKGCENDDATEERRLKREAAVAEMQKKKANAFTSRIGPTEEGTEAVHLTGCNCKRSGCIRRYCECFQSGVKCTDKCKCCECKNPAGTNPASRPIPPETVKGAIAVGPGSPGTGLVVEPPADGTAGSPGGAKFSPLKITAGSPGKAGFAPAAPSPTAFVDTALLAAAAVSRRDADDGATAGEEMAVEANPAAAAADGRVSAGTDGRVSAATAGRSSASAELEGEEAELLHAASATSGKAGAAGAGLLPRGAEGGDKGHVKCSLPPLTTSLPTPTPDEFASDTPESCAPVGLPSRSPEGEAPHRWAPNPKDGPAFHSLPSDSVTAPVAERPAAAAEPTADVVMADAPSLIPC